MKNIYSAIAILLVSNSFLKVTVFALRGDLESYPSISAESAVLIVADDATVLFGKDENKQKPIASTTKIMTALLVLEASERNNSEVIITDKMVPVEGSSMYLKVGNVLTLQSLAKGMLTISGNDAAQSAAIALGLSLNGFANMMNEKARQIGMKRTHFVTPSGLHDDEHYSTAYDMALLGAHAMENKLFFEIASSQKVNVPFVVPNETRVLRNKNKLLRLYPGCVGIKTGFTKKAGRCLVSCAERGGVRLVATTLKAGDDWNDHKKLYDYGFSMVESVRLDEIGAISLPVVGGKLGEVLLEQDQIKEITMKKDRKAKVKISIELPRFVYAPVEKGQIIGKVKYMVESKVIDSSDILAKHKVNAIIKRRKRYFRNLFY